MKGVLIIAAGVTDVASTGMVIARSSPNFPKHRSS